MLTIPELTAAIEAAEAWPKGIDKAYWAVKGDSFADDYTAALKVVRNQGYQP